MERSQTEETDLARRLAEVEIDADPLDRHAVLTRVQRSLFAEVDQPLRIGRFVVLERLGAGATGVVYAAYDPQLDRKVALKLLRTDADLGDEAHARLQREAQALAKLSHPHVVAVHDVGDVNGRVFIAMELLAGGTLRQFVEGERRRLPELLDVYLQAGEGLAAAHAAGLVHRDFKPDNVLLDRHGTARVVDFGLARDHSDPSHSMIELVATGERPPLELDARLTQTGTVLGTPAYMAPEQLAGYPADALTDQFSFCVALYEALYGVRPFEGDTLLALAEATRRGVARAPPPGRAVPMRIRRALLQGLRPEPGDRHPSMDALLTALRHDPGTRWRRWGLGAGALLGVAGLLWAAAPRPPTAVAAPCSGLQRELDGVWDDERRAAVGQTLVARGGESGALVWGLVEPRLHEYADAWLQARIDACEASEVRSEQSDALLDRRVLCLHRAHAVLQAAVDRLEQADRETVARAVQLVPDRDLVDECGAMGVLDDGDPPPPDPQLRQAIAALEQRLAAGYSLRMAGKYAAALTEAEAAVVEAEVLGHAPTLARAQWGLGAALVHDRRPQQAIDALAAAVAHAERGRADRTRVLALEALARRLSETSAADEARRVAAVTEALYGRLAHPPVGWPVRVEVMWGRLEWNAGRTDAAIERFERALALAKDDPDPLVQSFYADALADLGALHAETGRVAEALPLLHEALERWSTHHGPEHPEVASIHSNLGTMFLRVGRSEDAERELRRALEIRERSLGSDHGSLAPVLSNLGTLAKQRGRLPQSLVYLQRALELMERSLGPHDPALAATLHNLAVVQLRLGQPVEALALVQRALELRREGLGPEHPRTLDSVYQLGYLQQQAGDLDAARQTFEQHLQLLREHRPDDDESQVYSLVALADLDLLQGRFAQAQAAMERAQGMLGDGPAQAQLRMAVAFDLAQALAARGREPARARALARTALAEAEAAGVTGEPREQIERWLAEHGGNPRLEPGAP